MNAYDMSTQAQAAFDAGDYARAEQLWIQLLARVNDAATHCNYQLEYVQVLMAQKRYREAKALLDELFEITQDARCLHQLGQIALLEDQLDSAKMHFLAEQEGLAPDDYTRRSSTACILSALLLRQARLPAAKQYAELAAELAIKARDSGLLARATELLRTLASANPSLASERFSQELMATFRAPPEQPEAEPEVQGEQASAAEPSASEPDPTG